MKVFIIGWFGAGNIGDEAILLSELRILKAQLREVEFSILSFDPERTQKLTTDIPEVKKIVRMGAKKNIFRSNMFGIINTFRTVDVVIIGGGGLFQDIYNHYPTPFFASMALAAWLFRKRLIFYCLGIGPLNTRIGKKLCKFAANLAEIISVRDPESKELLKHFGVTREVCVAADPVFWLEPGRNAKIERLIATYRLEERRPVIAVCVHNLLAWEQKTKSMVAATLDTVIREKNAQVVFLPLGSYKNRWIDAETSDTVDILASKELAALMREQCSIITEELSPQEFLAVLQHVDLVISMRFHGLVMGLTANVPVIALTFRQETKLRNLMKRIEQEESVFDVEGLEQKRFLRRIEHVFSKSDAIKKELMKSVSFLRTESEQWNELLRRVLRNTLH